MVDPATEAKGTENVIKDDTCFKCCCSWFWPFEYGMVMNQKDWKDRCEYWWRWAVGATAWDNIWSPTHGNPALVTCSAHLSTLNPGYHWLLKYWKFPEHKILSQASVISPQFSLECSLFPIILLNVVFPFSIDIGALCLLLQYELATP